MELSYDVELGKGAELRFEVNNGHALIVVLTEVGALFISFYGTPPMNHLAPIFFLGACAGLGGALRRGALAGH